MNVFRDMIIIMIALSGLLTFTTINAIEDQNNYGPGSPQSTDIRSSIKSLEEIIGDQVEMRLSITDEMLNAGTEMAFSEDIEEQKRALEKIETSCQIIDQMSDDYLDELDDLQENLENKLDELTDASQVTLTINQEVSLDTSIVHLRDIRYGLKEGRPNSEITLEITQGGIVSYYKLEGGEKLEYNDYIIKYVSMTMNEESNKIHVNLMIGKTE